MTDHNKHNQNRGSFDLFTHPTRRQALGLALAGAAGMMLPWSRGGQVMAQSNQQRVIIAFSQEPTVMNPLMPHIEVDEGIHWNVFDPLFRIAPDGNFVPALAAEVPSVANGGISSDGLHWRIKLREGVTWHDGTPFTADDVKFTIDLINNPSFRASRRQGHELVRDIEVISPTEISWRMERGYAPYAALLSSTFIVPKHLLGEVEDPNSAPFNNAPVGTGAYQWDARVAGDHISLRRNPDYFDTPAVIEQAVFKYVPDLNVLYTQYKTGDIDFTGLQGITPDHYEEARNISGRTLLELPAASVESVALNLGRPQFQDPKVRQALYLAIDKASIIDALYYGLPTATESYMPQQSRYYNAELPEQRFDIDAANQLLDEAGWERGGDGIRAKDGVRLSFTNSTTAGNQVREQVQQFIQQTWREIGVEMSISNLPPAVMWGEYWTMSQFDSVVVGINFLTGADPDVSDYFGSRAISAQGGAGQNCFQFANEEADQLLAEGGANQDPEQRLPIYLRLQELIRDELPMLPLFQYTNLRGHREGLEGFENNVNLRIESWNVKAWRWS
ncbi:peptide ABC transporter substrate-binding protein [Halotalea alkalilenta]|uniref:ABC transporter substrate-binding protein n=1 Tax=Halotalea alkalilenta TaxID=376489 RepID=A0A172YBM2_9GAMM|nr:peptide ABC transporter substrate-binding protein [Halotalea alkalilenta]ANF56516.1 ABC transporter substrate-binding protein [Halotalea alkalilenta]